MPLVSEVRHAYAEFLSVHSWDYFVTDTWRHERRDPISVAGDTWRVFNKFGATRSFIAVEAHKLGGLHTHSLVAFDLTAGDQLPKAASLWSYLFKAHGRNRVEAAHDGLAVARYCAKYVVKDGFHYEIYGERLAWESGRLAS